MLRYPLTSLEKRLSRIEQSRHITGEHSLSSSTHTLEMNKQIWNSYDWGDRGEEWTYDAKKYSNLDPLQWKNKLLNNVLRKYIAPGSTVLEIGPGGGRWTQELLPLSQRLIIVDISEKVLEICRERFRDATTLDYHLIDEICMDFIPDNSINAIWSYDVFVHINTSDTENYIREFQRILKPGGYALIHHSGTYTTYDEEWLRKSAFRSYVDGALFKYFIEKNNLTLLEQSGSFVHLPGDLISIFTKSPI
ncbi:MAG: class I SAM-dependent methyltransferase [Patescibacteria group bacterium]